ncbi:MAG: tRNA (adenosine(37)-N6)-threonylcarbamoyltransferase complex ATPase subunit type 1 TsaE [Acidobacteriota bacterium]
MTGEEGEPRAAETPWTGLDGPPWTTRDEAETRALGTRLAAHLAPDSILLLSGEMGAGKTVLTQGIAAGLGIDPAEVQSPTYTLVREHRGDGGDLIHLDLYRLEPSEVADLGLEEVLDGPGVKVVEWPDRLPWPIPGALRLRLERRAGGGRRIQ